MGRRLFITGTDTGVGKTIVTAGLLRALRKAGHDAVAVKPVQTGVPAGDAAKYGDLTHVAMAARWMYGEDSLASYVPYCFAHPCSPHLAARLDNATIDLDALAARLVEIGESHTHVLAEGAGGVCVPLNEEHLMLDLMRRLAWPVLVVADNRLGMLNHTLLTLRCLREAGLTVAALVINACRPPSPEDQYLLEDNVAWLARHADARHVAELPYQGTTLGCEATLRKMDFFFHGLARSVMHCSKEGEA